MSRRVKSKYQKKTFESSGAASDTSANIYMSMLLSNAWRDLTANQQRLYLYCKSQYYGEKGKPNDDPLCFTMNQSKWSGLFGLYEKSNAKGFYRDMSALIEHGFVACQESGAITRTKSIYRFSDGWQRWGTRDFQVSVNELNTSLRRKRAKEKT